VVRLSTAAPPKRFCRTHTFDGRIHSVTFSPLFLIPARIGSKGIPRKNIRLVGGKPLLSWTIEAALKTRFKGRVVVSTESEEISILARSLGADVPFARPEELATDEATSLEVALHCLEWFKAYDDFEPSHLVLLQPTSPLRNVTDIDRACEIAIQSSAKAVVSVSRSGIYLNWLRVIDDDGILRPVSQLEEGVPRQFLKPSYRLNGAIYIIKSSSIANDKTWFPDPTWPYIMPEERSIDIDTPLDMQFADFLMRNAAYGGVV
jgi:CMP-N,N'-diacetyllegionaminic acid synthase